MVRIGATPEQLTELKSVFDRQSEAVEQLQGTVTSRLGAVDWQGPAHDRFVQRWEGEFKAALRRLQAELQSAGREAHETGQRIRAAGS